MGKTNEQHFEAFKDEADKWLQAFGLIGWGVQYDHRPLRDSRAECSWNMVGRVATLTLAKNWYCDQVSEREVRKSAFHEVVELLLSRIRILAKERFIQADEIDEEIHHLIRTLENTVWAKCCKEDKSKKATKTGVENR